MLTQLSIQNYALIDDLKVSFSSGFTTITGETGAGKSILLEGFALVLGNRADRSSLRDKERKCVIEAQFEIEKYPLQSFFSTHDLFYEGNTILRREIHPNGKSRAFVNDSPVTLDILGELGRRLIDVHSQHQTLQLTEHEFQLKVIDALADNYSTLDAYRDIRKKFLQSQRTLDRLIESQKNALREKDYHEFLLQELLAAELQKGMQESLEEQHEQLSNVESIRELLASGCQILSDEQVGISQLLRELKQATAKLAQYGKQYQLLNERINSAVIEMDDVSEELSSRLDTLESDPAALEDVGNKLQLLYSLQKKHQVSSVEELLEIKDHLAEKVADTQRLDDAIATARAERDTQEQTMKEKAALLSSRRQEVIPGFISQLEKLLHSLGIPNAAINLVMQPSEDYTANGKDLLMFLFSANKGGAFGELKKVASGGELSRIMLAIKSVLAQYEPLPTMMFDEIDTGVSGEISNRMGEIMLEMSERMQIFAITHLPQVASKGDHQFKVFKEDDGKVTHTRMKELQPDERIVELAEMLGGKSLSESAMAHARQLLN